MKTKELLRLISEILFPSPRSQCPHCGGVRCMGMCGVASERDSQAKSGSMPARGVPSPDCCEPGQHNSDQHDKRTPPQ